MAVVKQPMHGYEQAAKDTPEMQADGRRTTNLCCLAHHAQSRLMMPLELA